MLVAIAGGHGKIARRSTRLLVPHGEQVRGLIRKPSTLRICAPTAPSRSSATSSTRALRRSRAPTRSCSPPEPDQAVARSASGRSIATARSSCSSRPRGSLPRKITRDDVAVVLYAVLHEPRSVRQILYVGDGEDPIEQALAKALGGN